MKRLPAEIKERSDGLRHCWPGTRPWQELELCHVAEFTGLNVTHGEVADNKVITVDVWRQQHDLQRHTSLNTQPYVCWSNDTVTCTSFWWTFLPVEVLEMSNGRAKIDLAVHCQCPTCNLPTLDSILSGNVHRTNDRTARRWFLKTATLQLEPCLWRWWFLRQSHSLLFICSRPMHPFATTQNFSHPSWYQPTESSSDTLSVWFHPPSSSSCNTWSSQRHHYIQHVQTISIGPSSSASWLDTIPTALCSSLPVLRHNRHIHCTELWDWLQQIMNSKHLTDVCTSK